jgi:hypothetical protein
MRKGRPLDAAEEESAPYQFPRPHRDHTAIGVRTHVCALSS